MDPFDEWVRSATSHPCLQRWAEELIALGVTWDTFRRDPERVVKDLCAGNIPLLAANDIVEISSAQLAKNLENMPIPEGCSGSEVASRLKSVLGVHGNLVQFRGYASIGLGLIPEHKRSELQLSHCHLVDCPHSGCKEVADKMIIVDAMRFAFEHMKGATLCFVTGDVDYAYLLAVLQRPQWRTIVISKRTIQSMLHVNCDMRMRWEDVLQLHGEEGGKSTKPIDALPESPVKTSSSTDNEEDKKRVALTVEERWSDDVELLRTIIREEAQRTGDANGSVLKAQIGNLIRQTNPLRFPTRDILRSFFMEVIDRGIVLESGEGAHKRIRIPNAIGSMPLSTTVPLSLEELPDVIEEKSARMPFVLFVQWSRRPSSGLYSFPDHFSVTSYQGWAILHFPIYSLANRAVVEHPWLRRGSLVDWRKVSDFKAGTPWMNLSDEERQAAIDKLVAIMEIAAENDDIYVTGNVLRVHLKSAHTEECPNAKIASYWIHGAVKAGALNVLQLNQKAYCLPQHLKTCKTTFPSNFDTTAAEQYVVDLLQSQEGHCLPRKEVNESLSEAFDNLDSPFARYRVLKNARVKGLLHIAKCAQGQTVALSVTEAREGLNKQFVVVEDSGEDDDDDDEVDDEEESDHEWLQAIMRPDALPEDL